MDSEVWGKIESESDTEFLEDYGMMEEVPANSEESTINPIDCYRQFITDEEMLKFSSIVIEMGSVKMMEIEYY